MLTGPQLAIAISAVLLAAVLLGWVLHWIWMRMSNAAISDTARITEMVNRLHEAERVRQAAEEARNDAQTILATREAEMEERMAAMQLRLDGAVEGREAELLRQTREAQADAEASMAGLRSARERIMELETELDDLRRGD